jgi:hypothetical protein
MTGQISVVVASPEEAYNGNAELWCGAELLGVTVISDGRLHLRIDARADGAPWLIDTSDLALALSEASRELAAY